MTQNPFEDFEAWEMQYNLKTFTSHMLRQKLNRRVVARPLLGSPAPPVADPSLAETLPMILPDTQLDSQVENESCEPLPGGSGGEVELEYPKVVDGESDEVPDPNHQESPRSPPLEAPVVEKTPVVEKPKEVQQKQDLFNATEVTTRHEQFEEKERLQQQLPPKNTAKAKAKAKAQAAKEKQVAAKAKAAAKKALAKAKAAAKKATAKAKAALRKKTKSNAKREKNTDVAGASAEVEAEVPSPKAKKPRKTGTATKRAIHKDDDDDASVHDASKDGTSKPEAPQDTKETKGTKTFARRYRPVTESAGQRWDAIKAVFSVDVGPKFHRAASLEDW